MRTGVYGGGLRIPPRDALLHNDHSNTGPLRKFAVVKRNLTQ